MFLLWDSQYSNLLKLPVTSSPFVGLKEAQWSPLADSERKDSLSVNVEFVKFHLSRSRKLNFQSDQQQSKGLKGSDQSQAVIRFSSKLSISSCQLKSRIILRDVNDSYECFELECYENKDYDALDPIFWTKFMFIAVVNYERYLTL